MSLPPSASVAPSLLEPSGTSPITQMIDWFTGTLLGSLAVSLCVIAIAIVGLTMLTGRLSVRDGARVVIGCFILLVCADDRSRD